ncbi:MAG: voltage-gated potassium channel [Parvicellaceae bacterium]|jgi:voltage-gated potassium channel
MADSENTIKPWKRKLHEVIYEADTPLGKLFDVALLICIFLSVAAVMLESVEWISIKYKTELFVAEWAFTIFFSIEYVLRIVVVKKPFRYILSFYGLIDLLSIIPTYLGLFVTNASFLRAIRIIRLLRVFRIFKLARYMSEAKVLMQALKASKARILVFLFGVMVMVTIMGTIMYIIEDYPDTAFTSIPRSIYWAIVTITTVGYGDISPVTAPGQALSSILMIMGYAVIVISGVFVGAEVRNTTSSNGPVSTRACTSCSKEGHDSDAEFCKFCGESL